MHDISVFGEVTNFKISGANAYFDLKDESALLSCVKFGADDLNIKNGDRVTVYGKVNFYVKSGRINFIVGKAVASGMGDLYQKFLELKEKLEKQGLFSEEIKKPIPRFAKKIGVVTSETGAVIRDIIHVARKKNPYTDIIVYPSKVQGMDAEDELASGLSYFDSRDDIDTIIVARGGGSMEDLSPFNTEKIVRAIFACKKPVISAVGHETDFSLCDFAADLRVPTPSVAAEVAFFDYFEQVQNIMSICESNYYMVNKLLGERRNNLKADVNQIIDKTKLRLEESKNKVGFVYKDIENRVLEVYNIRKVRLQGVTDIIEKLSPLNILKNGYAVVETKNKKLKSVTEINIDDEINVRLSDGDILAIVTKKLEKEQ